MAPGQDSGRKQAETCVFVIVTHTRTLCFGERGYTSQHTCASAKLHCCCIFYSHTSINPHTPAGCPAPSAGDVLQHPLVFQLARRIPIATCRMTPSGCHGNCPRVIGITYVLLLNQSCHVNLPSAGTRCNHHWTWAWLGVCVHACVDLSCSWTSPLSVVY